MNDDSVSEKPVVEGALTGIAGRGFEVVIGRLCCSDVIAVSIVTVVYNLV